MKRGVVLGLAMCVSAVFLVGLALSQQGAPGAGGRGGQGGPGGAGPGGRGGQGQGFMGGMMGQMGMRNDAAIKQVLGATDQQWEQIKPKLERVRQLTADSRVSIAVMSGRMGGARRGGADTAAAPATGEPDAPRWMRPSQRQMTQQELTEGDKAAEALLDLLEKKDADAKQIQQKVEALRAIRQKAQKELATAQSDLRKVLDPRGQAMMSLMGIID